MTDRARIEGAFRRLAVVYATLGSIALCGIGLGACQRAAEPVTLPFDRFETVRVFVPRTTPREVVLLVSDDGGVDAGVEAAARALRDDGALVACADLARYRRVVEALPGDEVYPGADLEVLGQYVQRELALAGYRAPVVAGIGSGAAVAYAALAEQGPGTFRGGVGVDFCPVLALPKPAGEGSDLALAPAAAGAPATILPSPGPSAPFVIVSRAAGAACNTSTQQAFAHALPAGSVVTPTSASASLAAALETGLAALPAAAESSVGDLPLVPIPPSGGHCDTLVLVVSGDGGWAALVRSLADAFEARGFGVLGMDSLRYFWTPRTPDAAAADVARALESYAAEWRVKRIVLVGYSRGADVLPFLVRRLPPALRSQVALVALLGPGRETTFEFHVTDWLGQGSGDPAVLPVLPEVEALHGTRILCVQGEGEEDSLCDDLPPGLAEHATLPGGHHFDGDYEALARLVADAIERPAP